MKCCTGEKKSGVSQESQTSNENFAGSTDGQDRTADDVANASAGELEVCFGDKGNPFMLQLNDNDTAAAIAGVGYFDATDEFVEAVKNNPVLEDGEIKSS